MRRVVSIACTKESTTRWWSVSPPTITRRTDARQRASWPSSSNASRVVGTKPIVVTPCADTVRAVSSWPPDAGRSARRPPVHSGVKISQIAASKASGEFWRIVSWGRSGNVRLSHSMWLTTPRWGTATPFGTPVDPDVAITYALASGAMWGSGDVGDVSRRSSSRVRNSCVASPGPRWRVPAHITTVRRPHRRGRRVGDPVGRCREGGGTLRRPPAPR